jgi:phospholipase/carboxylesterase
MRFALRQRDAPNELNNKDQSMQATLLTCLEFSTGLHPTKSVIWLHGLGADGWDFVPIVHELNLPEDLAVRFIFPHANKQAVTVNGGAVMRAWYDIALDGLERKTDEPGVRQSGKLLDALIANERSRGMEAKDIVLAGFSQGGVIALHAGLRYTEALGGIMALSTYLAMPEALPSEAHPANRSIPILMAHGTQDQVISLSMAERSMLALKEHDYSVQWLTYPMAHSVAREELNAIRGFLLKVFA